jgi:hypothetical protein
MAPVSDNHSDSLISSDSETEMTELPRRPVGAWVIAGFVLLVTLAMWGLVSAIFYVRS